MAIFVVQIILSAVWLHFFKYGPVEWLWRSANYGRWQPLKKQAPAPVPVPTVQTVYLEHETNPAAGGRPPVSP